MRYSFLLLLFPFLVACGDQSQDLNKTCSIKDPLKEIDWLKEIVATLDKRAGAQGSEIIQFVYQDQCVIMVNDCFNCADNLVRVYDYEQNVICEFGGFAGLNTCIDFENEATDPQVLYENH